MKKNPKFENNTELMMFSDKKELWAKTNQHLKKMSQD